MVLYNAARRARETGSLINKDQGGGDKKAGFPYIIGRDSWASRFFHSVDPGKEGFKCCTLSGLADKNHFLGVSAKPGRPIWVRPGAGFGRY